MTYVHKFSDMNTIQKFGVDITLYPGSPEAGIVYEETEKGHFEEWSSDASTYHWFIIEGTGTFVIDDEKFEVQAKDLIVVPPKKRIHYFGNLKMVLITAPPYDETNEHHVRNVDENESPYEEGTQ